MALASNLIGAVISITPATGTVYLSEGLHMSSVQIATPPVALWHDAGGLLAPGMPVDGWLVPLDDEIIARPSAQGFAALRAAYLPTGGIAHGDDLARLLEDRQLGGFVSLGRLLVLGGVFSFEWQGSFWIPMFQFELRDLSLKPGPRQVLAELMPLFSGWSLAAWFVRPNSWLNDQIPVDLLDLNLPAVLEAARADRFVVAG
jgi:hypothetical protein